MNRSLYFCTISYGSTFHIVHEQQLAHVVGAPNTNGILLSGGMSGYATNDHFLVATAEGLRASVWKNGDATLLTGPGHAIIHIPYSIGGGVPGSSGSLGSSLSTPLGTTEFGADIKALTADNITSETEASAITPESAAGEPLDYAHYSDSKGFRDIIVLAPETGLYDDLRHKEFIFPVRVKRIYTDTDMDESSSATFFAGLLSWGSRSHYDTDEIVQRFATLVSLDGIYPGYHIVTSVITPIEDDVMDDYGDVVQALYDSKWNQVGTRRLDPDHSGYEIISSPSAARTSNASARAHSMRYGASGVNYLVTCWDIRVLDASGADTHARECRMIRQVIT